MPHLHLGLPMWANPDWRGGLYPPHGGNESWLADYARVFSTVEGNTTFYSGTPREPTVASWARQAPPGFRFCFKLPASLTHERRLADIEADLDLFLESLSPLHDRLGPMMVQLPRDFGPDELPRLDQLLARWPAGIPCAVEVRHREFFHKGWAEKALNRMLITYGANRVMLDVRPLFATAHGTHPGLQHARAEKPRVPLHVLSTGDCPLVRFIGHFDTDVNDHCFIPWIDRLILWINQGKTPYFMVHTPDNRGAPELARRLYSRLGEHCSLPSLAAFAGEHQTTLF